MSLLESITTQGAATATPTPEPERKQLTTGQVLVAVSNIGRQLEIAIEAYKRLPDCTARNVEEQLNILREAARNVIVNAVRLTEGNQ